MKTQAYSNTNVIILDRVFMIATLLLRSPTTILSSRTNHFTTATLNLLCFASTNRTRLPWRLSICEISTCGVLDIDMRDIDMQRKQMRTICGIALSCTLLKKEARADMIRMNRVTITTTTTITTHVYLNQCVNTFQINHVFQTCLK